MRIPLLNIFDEDMRDVVSGAAFAFALRIMGAGFGFGFNLLLARILGAGGVGIYYLSLTVTTIATVIGRLGLDNSLLRYASVGAANHNWDQVAGIYRQALYLALAASGFTSVLMFMFAPWIACDIFKKPALITLLRIMAFSVVPFSLLNLYAELLKAFKKTGQASFIQGTGIPLACLLMLICLAWTTLSVDEIALIYVIASISVLSCHADKLYSRGGQYDRCTKICINVCARGLSGIGKICPSNYSDYDTFCDAGFNNFSCLAKVNP